MTPSAARLDAIGVVVSDIPTSIAFYEQLGIEFPENADAVGHGHVEAALPGGLRFLLDTADSVTGFDPSWMPPIGGHRVALAFRCESPAEVDRVFAELTGAGAAVHKEPWDAFWGQRYAQVKDPDGNVVDLFAPTRRNPSA